MRSGCLLLVFIAGCSANDATGGAWSATVEEPADVDQVIEAVRALPECDGVHGGVIHWHARDFTCKGMRVTGCSFPYEDPQRIEVVYRGSAWDSSLPHELCHLCGYIVGPAGDTTQYETEAEACAYRAKRARPPSGGTP